MEGLGLARSALHCIALRCIALFGCWRGLDVAWRVLLLRGLEALNDA